MGINIAIAVGGVLVLVVAGLITLGTAKSNKQRLVKGHGIAASHKRRIRIRNGIAVALCIVGTGFFVYGSYSLASQAFPQKKEAADATQSSEAAADPAPAESGEATAETAPADGTATVSGNNSTEAPAEELATAVTTVAYSPLLLTKDEAARVKELAEGNEVTEDENGNYIAPSILTEEEWQLLFGKMTPYARRDSLPTMLTVRSHLSGFSRPVGLMPIVDYEWIEARFLGLAREDASQEIKDAAAKGKVLNPADEKAMAEALAELDEKVELWEKEFNDLSEEEQGIKVKLDGCELMLQSPIWAEQFLQFAERYKYFTANYGDELEELREYFDGILKPVDESGNDIPKDQALGWDQVYEYEPGHDGDPAYRRTTEEYRKMITPLCQLILDSQYVGVVDKPLYRNWELNPETKYANFLVTTRINKTDTKKSFKLVWLAKDGETVNVAMGINWYDSRIGEYWAAKTPPKNPGTAVGTPVTTTTPEDKPSGGGGGGGGSTPSNDTTSKGAENSSVVKESTTQGGGTNNTGNGSGEIQNITEEKTTDQNALDNQKVENTTQTQVSSGTGGTDTQVTDSNPQVTIENGNPGSTVTSTGDPATGESGIDHSKDEVSGTIEEPPI